ncbi:MAG: RDD family protein [Ilumatobacter sp.]|uniref:RDD family protein n=1 Tax=Ilumatobacter sp. TaxID=1967498 RepID=UPI003297D406
MTNTGGTPAGWYHAPGDPEGTQRYWDGSQWIGDPQAAPSSPQSPASDATVAYNPTPASDPGAGQPPQYGAPGGQQPPSYGGQPPAYGSAPPPGAGAPPGYTAFGSPGTAGAVGAPAEFGQRAIAYLIDIAPIVGVYVVVLVASLISDVLGLLVSIVGYLAVIGYAIWNFYIVQGKTGQTIGKEKQGIKLVSDATGQPVGGGMAFVRYLCSGAFVLLCCIGSAVNLLSPLWNSDKKTYSDKIMKMSVVRV